MSSNIGYPVVTVFNASGTYTSDQNMNGVDSKGVRKLIGGLSVGTVVGGTGAVDLAIGFLAPDGNYYTLGRLNNATGEQSFTIDGPIPETLNVGIAIHGATSASVSYWVMGQA